MKIRKLPHRTDVNFYEDEHEYIIDGKVVPSVTTILAELKIKPKPPEGVTNVDKGRQRGHAVHKIMEIYHSLKEGEVLSDKYNDWVDDQNMSISFDVISPYAKAGIKHAQETNIGLITPEYRGVAFDVNMNQPLYAFTIDVAGVQPDDYKTSKTIGGADYIQVAAYASIYDNKEDEILGHLVQLNSDATYKVIDVGYGWLSKWFEILSIYYSDMLLSKKIKEAKEIVKNQVKLPRALSLEISDAKTREDEAKAEYSKKRKKVEKYLLQNGVTMNGVFYGDEEQSLNEFSFNKSADSFSTGLDLVEVKKQLKKFKNWKEIEEVFQSCSKTRFKTGSYSMRFKKDEDKSGKANTANN